MARLGDLYQITSGGTPSRKHLDYYQDGTIPWVKTGDLKEKYLRATDEKITEIGLKNSSARIYPKDTVLIAMYGATIGASSILKIEAATNQACAAFVKRDDILPEYLYAFLESQQTRFIKEAVGGAQPNISAGYLKEIDMPLISIEEQRRIAALLDKVSDLIAKRRAQLDKLDLLVKARFVEMFGDMVLNPMNWPEQPLEDMADIVSGITKGRKTKETELIEVPYMAVSNVKDGYIDWTTVKTILATKAEIEQYRLLPGDVLMTEGGDPDKLGRGAIIQQPLENCIHQNHIFRVRLNENILLSSYFAEFLHHQKAKQYFLRCAKQTTGIASINMRQLKGLPTLVPPLDMQYEFKGYIEKVDRSRYIISFSLEKLEMLRNALMQQYFG
mgnify:CR=1 FL=1